MTNSLSENGIKNNISQIDKKHVDYNNINDFKNEIINDLKLISAVIESTNSEKVSLSEDIVSRWNKLTKSQDVSSLMGNPYAKLYIDSYEVLKRAETEIAWLHLTIELLKAGFTKTSEALSVTRNLVTASDLIDKQQKYMETVAKTERESYEKFQKLSHEQHEKDIKALIEGNARDIQVLIKDSMLSKELLKTALDKLSVDGSSKIEDKIEILLGAIKEKDKKNDENKIIPKPISNNAWKKYDKPKEPETNEKSIKEQDFDEFRSDIEQFCMKNIEKKGSLRGVPMHLKSKYRLPWQLKIIDDVCSNMKKNK